jgi:CO/xanthine dehydrogenase Mo-binding subunit
MPASAVAPTRVVGQPVAHHDFIDKVKGSILYAADWKLPGMLHGRVVRAPVSSARIVSIDTEKARALRGVAAVLTSEDVPSNRLVEKPSGGPGELLVAMPVLAHDRVRYAGEPVALVAAETPELADDAAELVQVEYEELPGVFDPEAALLPGAPLVHDDGNVLVTWHIQRGDAQAGMAAADVVIEGEYRTQHVEHAALETESGVGWIENDVVTLRVATQIIEHATDIAQVLKLPANRVRLIAAYMGGSFGSKEGMTVEPYLALLVWKTRRPVRMVWSRQESIFASTKGHPFIMRYRTGATNDGRIVAQDVDLIGDAGAYACKSARVLFYGAALSCGPYFTPNVSVRSRAVFTNNVPTSAFRGFGARQVTLGYESQMDRLAETLAMDKAEVRRRNFLHKGDAIPTGETLDTAVAVGETLERALARLGEPSAPSGPSKRVGRGFACNMHPYGRTVWFRDSASAWLSLQTDGSLLIRSGVSDVGGGQAASLCQIASEILGVSLERISVYIGDTALTPPAGGTFATRQLLMSGNAVMQAALQLRDLVAPVAAEALGRPVGGIVFEDDRVKAASLSASGGAGGDGISLGELVRLCEARSVDPTTLYVFHPDSKRRGFDPAPGQLVSFPDYAYGTHAAEVEVDLETGEVEVLKYASCHDVGRAINPLRVEGQMQGGAMQGLGYALMEEIILDEGKIASSLLANYLIPTSDDMPEVMVDIVESGEGKGPMNARGIGEAVIGNAAPTIANAVADAIGFRPTKLPITPERVLALLDAADATSASGPVSPVSGVSPE